MSYYRKPTPRERSYRAARIAVATRHDTSDLFTVFCQNELGYAPVKEFLFHPTRKWRFDYAIPALKIAIECDGGVFTGGRHVRPLGYMKDMEKFNAAAEMGWVVLKFTPRQLVTMGTIETLRATIDKRVVELAERTQNK